MRKQIGLLAVILALIAGPVFGQKLLIYMDLKQTDHLKAYGVAYWALERGVNIEWLLNYRGGSFLMDYLPEVERECRVRGVAFDAIEGGQAAQVYADIEGGNMEVIFLEKAPAIAIYTPQNKQVWDDAVTLVLDYKSLSPNYGMKKF
jgi:hypothetical protein